MTILKLLILDIDETLVHARKFPLERKANSKTSLYYVYKRPYVDKFLQFCRTHFEVAIWTTGGYQYGQQVFELGLAIRYYSISVKSFFPSVII